MNKICQKILVFLCLFIVGVTNASAASACDYETQVKLNSEAANIKTSYEIKEIKTGNQVLSDMDEGMEDEVYTGVVVSIYNLTDNLYLEVTNSLTGEKKTYTYADTDNGTITFTRGEKSGLGEIVTYEVMVYSNHSDCKGEELKKINVVTPRYNYFSAEGLCADEKNAKKYYCQPYITEELNMSYEDFVKQAMAVQNSSDNKQNDDSSQNENFLKKYGVYIVVTLIGVALIWVVTTVIVRKKQRSSIK